MFFPGKPFQPSLMFAVKARAYPSEASFRCSTLDLLANDKLDWKGLPGTNTLAYYENPYITTVKRFIGLAPGSKAFRTNVMAPFAKPGNCAYPIFLIKFFFILTRKLVCSNGATTLSIKTKSITALSIIDLIATFGVTIHSLRHSA